jgi:hypothetical protein
MSQQKEFCKEAKLALSVATCAQVLHEGGHSILNISIKANDAVIAIAHAPQTKKLNGKACGSTFIHGLEFGVYQAEVSGVLVRWLEPSNTQSSAKAVH